MRACGGPSDVYVCAAASRRCCPRDRRRGCGHGRRCGRTHAAAGPVRHARPRWRLERALHIAAGVTTVRDMGNDNASSRASCARIEAGTRWAAHRAGRLHRRREPDTRVAPRLRRQDLDEAKQAIDWYAQHGYRQIKLYNSFPKDGAGDAAHAHALGLRVSGHVPAFMRAEEAVRAGYDEIQHINQVMLNFLVTPEDDTRTLLRFIWSATRPRTSTSTAAGAALHRLLASGTSSTRRWPPSTSSCSAGRARRTSGGRGPLAAGAAAHVPASIRWTSDDANASRYRASYEKMLEWWAGCTARGSRWWRAPTTSPASRCTASSSCT